MNQNNQRENPSSNALGWLLEMELVNNPVVLNSMIMNVFKSMSGVKDTEFVIDLRSKKLLVFLELKPLHSWLFKNKIHDQAFEMFDQILPTFKKRIVFDRSIMQKALQITNKS